MVAIKPRWTSLMTNPTPESPRLTSSQKNVKQPAASSAEPICTPGSPRHQPAGNGSIPSDRCDTCEMVGALGLEPRPEHIGVGQAALVHDIFVLVVASTSIQLPGRVPTFCQSASKSAPHY